MKRFLAVVSTVALGLFFVFAVTVTQAMAPLQPPIEQAAQPSSPTSVQHTQPITPGAPAEVVLVLDRSESQSYDFASMPALFATQYASCNQANINDMYVCLNGGTLSNATTVLGCNNETIPDPNPDYPALTRGICQPFRKSREAAYRFIQQLRPGIDRIALINFHENATTLLPLTGTLTGGPGSAIDMLNNMDVYVSPSNNSQPNPTGHVLCNTLISPEDSWKCGSSNIAEGLIYAYDVFADLSHPPRPEAQWVVALIADGPANRAPLNNALAWSDPQYGVCPESERATPLKCRDADANSRHRPDDSGPGFGLYDADDYARDSGDLLGLDPDLYPDPWPWLPIPSAGVRLFTIGFGKSTLCNNGTYTPPSNGQPATCTNSNPIYGDPDAGEQLLRYIADMGDDGILSTGPCLDTQAPFRVFDTRADASGRSDDTGLGLHCGNYYFAPEAASLPTITLDIAQRIITGSEPLPAFSATPLSGFSPLVVTFTNQSTGDYTSLLWQFGDGATSADLNPMHTYATAGVFTVTLTLTNPTTSATLTQTNYITVRTPNIPGAPADIVLVFDRSESQSYNFAAFPEPYRTQYAICSQSNFDDIYACLNGGMLSNGITVNGCNNETIPDPNPDYPTLTRGICQPFRKNKEAAYRFIQQLRPNIDRVALASFAEYSGHHLTMTFNLSDALTALNTLDVYRVPTDASQPNPNGHVLCNAATSTEDFWKCGSSNVGGGLIQAQNEFSAARPEAQWVAILIADGAANRTSYDSRVPWSDPQYGNCPQSERTTPIKCRDLDANSRHFITATVDPLYDADDYAREYGDTIGLNPDLYPSLSSAGIRLFTIGLGKNMVCSNGYYTAPVNGQPAGCSGYNPVYGDPDAGEQLLRYIADMGDDGNLSTGPCLDTQAPFRVFDTRADASGRSDDAGLGLHCGNYYFAPDASHLSTITLEIARRIIAAAELTPEFTASPLSGVAPLSVTFDNSSIGPYTSTLWTFGDGNTSAAISPTHMYANPGVYTVMLTVANITATASITRSNYITVYQPVAANFSATPLSGTAPLTVTFTNQSTGDYTNSLWNFGNGATSTQANPAHTYDFAGVYTVTLQVSGPGGTDWFTRSNYITVYQPVAAAFSATPLSGAAPLTVTFTNQSTGDYTNSLWNFGDGITSTLLNSTHTYDLAGIYTVTLQVSGPGGADWLTRSSYITIYQPVAASFSATPLSGTAPLTVTFTNQSTGDYTNSLWYFGDGITSTLSNPTHTYAAGTYTITLRVTGLSGTNVFTRTNYIYVSAPRWQIYLPAIHKS